jgi:hypothetical protein
MIAFNSYLSKLQDIAGNFYAHKIERNEARSAVIDVYLEATQCSRVSLWRFDEIQGVMSLLCFASKTAVGSLDTTQSRLFQSEYEAYFDQLVKAGYYLSVDAMNDEYLQPMRDHYLVPNHVYSLLDCAFTINGRAYGMVCCEQTDATRQWDTDDVLALRAIVSKLALLMAGSDDARLWSSPSLSMEPIAHGDTRPGRLDLDPV